MYFRFVNSYTVMLVVQQLPCFCRPQVGKLQEPPKSPLVQIGAALEMKGSLQSAVCSKTLELAIVLIHL